PRIQIRCAGRAASIASGKVPASLKPETIFRRKVRVAICFRRNHARRTRNAFVTSGTESRRVLRATSEHRLLILCLQRHARGLTMSDNLNPVNARSTNATARGVFSPQKHLHPTNEYLTDVSDSGEDYCLIRCTLPAGVVVPLHSHADRETFYVLSGK